jgi:hypothetical protein
MATGDLLEDAPLDHGFELLRILPRTPMNKASLGALGFARWHHALVSSASIREGWVCFGHGAVGRVSRTSSRGGVPALGHTHVRRIAAGVPSSFNDYLLEIVVVAAFVLTLVTLAGLHAAQRHSGRYGILGAAGFWLTFLGYVVVLVTVHLTLLAGGEPILSVRLVGGLLVLVGSILLGAMTIRARVLPWWCGVLLIVGLALGEFLNNVAEGLGSGATLTR